MNKAGIVVLLAGIVGLIAYGVYGLVVAMYGESGVPIVIKIAVPAVVVGLALVLIGTIRDRIRDRRGEDFKEVKY